jgi:hypothetical protein
MNKIIISGGGQPIYLEDLALLQNNADMRVNSYSHVSTGDAAAYLMRRMNLVDIRCENDGTWYSYDSGILVYRDELYEFEAGQVFVPIGGTVYVCPRSNEEDVRVFEDGIGRPCRSVYSATITSDRAGIDVAYDVDDIPVYTDLLGETIGSLTPANEIIIAGRNGYSGDFDFRTTGVGKTVFRLNIKKSSNKWDETTEDWNGVPEVVVGELSSYINYGLDGKCVLFDYDNIKFRLRFGLNDAKVYLAAIDLVDFSTPIVPWIRLMFTDKDLRVSGEPNNKQE